MYTTSDSAITIAAHGRLSNLDYDILDRNARTYMWDDRLANGDTYEVSFDADGDIHVSDGETLRWHDLSPAEMRAYIERVDPFQVPRA